jgi:hypothetical protein
MLLIPLLLLHHHSDDPVFLVLVQDNVIVPGIERVEDFSIVVPFILLERRLFLVVLYDNVIAVLRLRSGVDDDDFAFLELRLHGIALHLQCKVVLALHPVRDRAATKMLI